MNDRQKAFCEHFAACGNAAEAARRAGYSDRTARSIGQRLLTYVDIISYVEELRDTDTAARIATADEVREFWTSVFLDENAKMADRLRASELLAKSGGLFLHFRPDDGGGDRLMLGEHDGEDVVIVLPDNGRDKELLERNGGVFDGME